MKKIVWIVMMAISVFAVWRIYDYWDHSPARIGRRIESVRENYPDLDEHVGEYGTIVDRIGQPFYLLSTLGSLLKPIDQLRNFEMELGGTPYLPWAEIASRSIEAQALDIAIDAVMSAVDATVEVDDYCTKVIESAAVFQAAASSPDESAPTSESILRVRESAVILAEHIEAMSTAIRPAAEAVGRGASELDDLIVWLDETQGENFAERSVLSGMRAALGATRSALSVSDTAISELLGQMDKDTVALRDIARIASRVR